MAIFRQHSTKNLCGGQIDGLKFRQDKSTFKVNELVDRAGLYETVPILLKDHGIFWACDWHVLPACIINSKHCVISSNPIVLT